MTADSRQLRERYLAGARRLVVKVGTNVLTSPGLPLDRSRVGALGDQIAALVRDGRQVALVTSGAIGAGMGALGLTSRPHTLPGLQAAASVGQGLLVALYDEALRRRGLHAGQILLTRDDFDARDRYLNASNTIHHLFSLDCVPVINENDTVSTDEIKFGDNDLLAALVTHMIRAEALILLTSVPGLQTTTPPPAAVLSVHEGAREGRAVADVVSGVDPEVMGLVRSDKTSLGLGGMGSKLEAVRIAVEAGEAAVIADGKQPDTLIRLMAGEPVGTLFLPAERRLQSRKRWIRFTGRPRGGIVVDEGARRALCESGKSLLPSGVLDVEGEFGPGDIVRISTADGRVFARGLTNYSSDDVHRIKGLNSSRIQPVLGHKCYDEVVHRDNLALLA